MTRLISMAGQNDERKVGPRRLPDDPLREGSRVLPEKSFLGKKNYSDAGVYLANQFGKAPANDRFHVRFAEELRSGRSIAADRSEHENMEIPVSAHQAYPRRGFACL
jgi:hypothetical protein